MNYVFFGTPDRAEIVLEEMKAAGLLPKLIVTAPDKPVGRKQIITETPVKKFAINNNIPVITPGSKLELLNYADQISSYQPEFLLVVAYGYLIPNEILAIPTIEPINVHYSILPRWRGASPVVQQILHGDKEVGFSIMRMVEKLDAGEVFYIHKYPLPTPLPTTGKLAIRMSEESGKMLPNILNQIKNGELKSTAQDESLVTTCTKLSKSDGELDFKKPDRENYRRIKAMQPWPQTFFEVEKDNQKIRIKVVDADLIDNKLVINQVTPAGRKLMTWDQCVNWLGYDPTVTSN